VLESLPIMTQQLPRWQPYREVPNIVEAEGEVGEDRTGQDMSRFGPGRCYGVISSLPELRGLFASLNEAKAPELTAQIARKMGCSGNSGER
jgi:hypothetical protein